MPIAHLGHAELNVTDLGASTRLFTEMMGLEISHEQPGRTYLRAWQDFDHHTLVLTESDGPGMVHMGWRVPAKEDAEEIRSRLDAVGVDASWTDGSGELGHGEALAFSTPGGLPFELYWEVEPHLEPAESASRLPSHPSRIPARGVPARRFDHVTTIVDDVEAEQGFLTDVLGIHHRYYNVGPDGRWWGSWLSCNNLSHEVAVTKNAFGTGGMLHHIAYYCDTSDEVLRLATLLVDHGYELEWGPGKHGTSGATFLYFREPSGNRVEIWTGGILIFSPDWQAIRWDGDIAPLGNTLWGTPMPESFKEGTPFPATLEVSR